jgi:hypothetical protein
MGQHFISETVEEVNRAMVRSLISDLDKTVRQLDCEIRAEEERTLSYDPNNVAYSPLARSLRIRRDNLRVTITTLELKAGAQAIQSAA